MKVKILITAQHPSMWNSLESVYLAFKRMASVEVILLAANYYVQGKVSPLTEQLYTLLDAKKYAYFKESFDLNNFKPHVVFLQTPYDSTRSRHLHVTNLTAAGYRLCYIPYGLEMGGGDLNYQYQYDSDLQNYAWRVFLRSSNQKEMFGKYCKVGSKHAVITGHPKFDLTCDVQDNPILVRKIRNRKVILWTPHFAVRLPATWSTYRLYGESILNYFKSNPDIFLVIRPHPKFFQVMHEVGLFNNESENAFRDMCHDQDNIWLDTESNYLSSFKLSDAILADVGSFLLEYLVTEKPILYLKHPEGSPLNDDGKLVENYYIAKEFDDIINFIEMISDGADPMREQRLQSTNDYLFGLDGRAGERIANYIVEELTEELNDTDLHINPQSDEALQNKVSYYWKNSPNSLNMHSVFYELKDKAYKELLALLPKLDYAVDLGCGEGKYTLPLATKCSQLDAFDISPKLIHVANNRKEKFNISNVEFIQSSYQIMQLSTQPNLFSCNELTSSIIDNREFAKLMNAVKKNLTPNGYLILIDQFSLVGDKLASQPSGLALKLRSIESIKSFILQLGYELLEEQTIVENADLQVSAKQFLFKNRA